MKAREQEKSSMQLLEKRLIEAQAKRNELEKELNVEKRNKMKEEHAAARALAAAQSNKFVSFFVYVCHFQMVFHAEVVDTGK